jgi:hypothetical protein
MPIRKPREPYFKFELTMEAAEKNFLLLMHKYGGSMELALKAEQDSPMGMGSEFRPIESLRSIYGSHPLWHRMVPILSHGSKWPLEPLSEELRLTDMKEGIEFGNHKGAKEDPRLFTELVSKDIKHGNALVFPLSKAHQIPDILLAPMNIQHQITINESGKIVDKKRLTHDQSYK